MKRFIAAFASLALVTGLLSAQDGDQPEQQPPAETPPIAAPETEPVEEPKEAPAPETRVFAPPSVEDVKNDVVDWLAQQTKATDEQKKVALALWTDVPADESAELLLVRVVNTFAEVNEATAKLVADCKLSSVALVAPEADVIDDATNEFEAQNLRAFYARYLVRRRMYDEALWTLEEVDPAEVIDPATALFNRAVCEQQLLMRDEAAKSLTTLLENTESVPPRYTTVATLMKYNLQSLRPDTLDEVAHLMNDVENRLDLGRAGQRVQKKEERIVAVLDKIIEKLEQGGGGGGGGGGGTGKGDKQSSAPANESRIMDGKGDGNVDEKSGEKRDVWGSLPPKQAAKAKNIINRNFPPHYKRAIDKYTREVAKKVVVPSDR